MLTLNDAFYSLRSSLQPLYDTQEAAAIAHEVIEHITGLGKMQRLIKKENLLTDAQEADYERISAQLRTGMPLQYCFGFAWFLGNLYFVDKQVLIPRPETEELVQWVVDDHKSEKEINILDIGTGSGCIPISLKINLPAANITSCDVSNEALKIARVNADSLGADIQLQHADFLQKGNWAGMGMYDVLVSNPPYIPQAEAANMHSNVKDHEPELALFVPDNDPLLFYRAIAEFAETNLKPGGYIYCELHYDHAKQTRDMFGKMGFEDVELRKDMHGNPRMLKAKK